jgi:hypothetical protein
VHEKPKGGERKIMRKTLLLFTTMALTLLLAAGMAWAALPAPTVSSTVPANGTTGVALDANITATFSEAMKARSINTNTFYLLPGEFTAKSVTKNPKRFCFPGVTPPATPATATAPACPAAIPATVSYAGNTATLNPTSTLAAGTEYTAVVEGTGDGDYVAVKDTGGTAMYTDFIFYFTTASAGGGDHPTL